MEILWTTELITELKTIVEYLKKNPIGSVLEKFSNYYVYKHREVKKLENYSMNFLDQRTSINRNDLGTTDDISDGEYRLAFLCELTRSIKNSTSKIYRSDIYKYLNYMISYCLRRKIKNIINRPKLDNETSYLISLINENVGNSNQDMCLLSLGFVKQIWTIFESGDSLSSNSQSSNDLRTSNNLPNLITQSEIIDMSFYKDDIKRAMLDVIYKDVPPNHKKKTIYLRFLLCLSYELTRKKFDIQKFVSFSNYKDFVFVITNPVIEVTLFLISEIFSR